MKKVIFIFIISISLMMSSCSKIQIDKTAIVNSICIINRENKTIYQFNTVKNENESVLKKYKTNKDNFADAKKQLEKTSVSNLFLGQTECIILSNNTNQSQINDLIRYFSSGYECSPSVKLLFATKEAMDLIEKEEISTERILELSNLISKNEKDISMNIYTFYNSHKKKDKSEVKVPLLYVNSQLDIKSTAYNELKSG